MIGNSRSNHLGAQGTFNPAIWLLPTILIRIHTVNVPTPNEIAVTRYHCSHPQQVAAAERESDMAREEARRIHTVNVPKSNETAVLTPTLSDQPPLRVCLRALCI